jgi:hypothetical protein
LKKNIFLLIIVSVIFLGCGYKANPIYVDETKGVKKEVAK